MAYRVVAGDTLWDIAEDNGTTVDELLRLNPQYRADPNRIFPGNAVVLPQRGGGNGGTPRPAPTGQKPGPKPPAKPPAKPAPPKPPPSLLDQLTGLPGSERDAYAALTTLFNSYGLGSLAPVILKYLQQGFGSDTITILLQQTPEYQARFAGNAQRIKKGLQVLTPAEYLSAEASYRQILLASGLDPSFMNQKQYAEWIAMDISPTEIQDRTNMAIKAVVTAPPELTTAFARMGIHAGDLASYFLNDHTPPPVLQQKLNQAQIIEAGLQAGITNPSIDQAAQFAKMGTTYEQALTGYQRIADLLPTADQLSQIYQAQQPYGQSQAEQEFLGNSGTAQLAREQLGRQETAAFSGTAAAGQKSFAQQTPGAGSGF